MLFGNSKHNLTLLLFYFSGPRCVTGDACSNRKFEKVSYAVYDIVYWAL